MRRRRRVRPKSLNRDRHVTLLAARFRRARHPGLTSRSRARRARPRARSGAREPPAARRRNGVRGAVRRTPRPRCPPCRGRSWSSTSSAPSGAPGLYRLPQGSRIADAVARAGGATRKAELDLVNLAAPLADGSQIVVPARAAAARGAAAAAGRPRPPGRVHLNTATLEADLDALPGVGPVTAQKILDYRQQHGAFGERRRARRDPGHRPEAPRPAPRAGGAVTVRAPHALVAALCLGLAAVERRAAAVARRSRPARSAWPAVAAGVQSARPYAVFAAALACAGWWWGSVRLAALDRSVLAGCGRHGGTRPARGDGSGAAEPLPAARAGPRSALRRASTCARRRCSSCRRVARRRRARSCPPSSPSSSRAGPTTASTSEPGCDARASTSSCAPTAGASSAARGGSRRLADRLRAHVERSLARGASGERGAVLAGVVLGDDQAVAQTLRDRFRASGLYHLLAVSGQNVAFVAVGVLVLAAAARRAAPDRGGRARSRASPRTSSPSARSRRWCARGSSARSARSRGSPRGSATAGTSCCSRRSCSSRGTRTRLLDAGFQLSFAAVAAIFVLVRPLMRILEGYPLPRAGCARRSRSRRPAASPPRRCCGSSSTRCRSSPSRRTRSRRRRWRRCSALALSAALLDPVSPGAAAVLAGLAGWCAAWLALCARVIGGLPFAQVSSTRGGARARGRRSPRLRPMLGGDGAAQAGLPDLGQRPAEDPPRARAAPQPLRGRRGRASRRRRASGRRRRRRLQRARPLRRRAAPRHRRGRRRVEGAGREGRRGVPEDAGARDGARARRHRAEEGLGARESVREGRRGAAVRRAAQARPAVLGRRSSSSSTARAPTATPAACSSRSSATIRSACGARSRSSRRGPAARPSPRTNVRLLASMSAETTVFMLTDAWGKRDVGAALAARRVAARARGVTRELPRLAALLANHVARVRACQALADEGVGAARRGAAAEDASVRRREGVRPRGELLAGRARARARAPRRARPRAQGQQPAVRRARARAGARRGDAGAAV